MSLKLPAAPWKRHEDAVPPQKVPRHAGANKEVLAWAKRQQDHHDERHTRYAALWYAFQALTIIAAGTTTILAAAKIAPIFLAIPGAIATLSASILAAFHFHTEQLSHGTAARLLGYEILKFENNLREYRADGKAQSSGVDLFMQRVERISRVGDQEPEQEDVHDVRVERVGDGNQAPEQEDMHEGSPSPNGGSHTKTQ